MQGNGDSGGDDETRACDHPVGAQATACSIQSIVFFMLGANDSPGARFQNPSVQNPVCNRLQDEAFLE